MALDTLRVELVGDIRGLLTSLRTAEIASRASAGRIAASFSAIDGALARAGRTGGRVGSQIGLGLQVARGAAIGTTVAIGGVGLAISALAARGVAQVGSLQESFALLRASGETDLDRLRQSLDQLQESGGRAARVFSEAQLGQSLAELVKAGISASEGLDLLRSSTRLAAVEGTELSTQSALLLQNLRAFRLEAGDAARAGDALATASLEAAGTATDLSKGIATVGPVARAAGLTLEQTLALLVDLDNRGLRAANEGATGLRSVLAALVDPTSRAADQLAALGVSTREADGSIRPTRDVLLELRDALDGNSEAAQAAAVIFDTRAIAAMLALGTETDTLTEKIENSEGSLVELSDTITDTLPAAVEEFQASITDLGEALASAFAGTLTELLEFATRIVQGLEDIINGSNLAKNLFRGLGVTNLSDEATRGFVQAEGLNRVTTQAREGQIDFGDTLIRGTLEAINQDLIAAVRGQGRPGLGLLARDVFSEGQIAQIERGGDVGIRPLATFLNTLESGNEAAELFVQRLQTLGLAEFQAGISERGEGAVTTEGEPAPTPGPRPDSSDGRRRVVTVEGLLNDAFGDLGQIAGTLEANLALFQSGQLRGVTPEDIRFDAATSRVNRINQLIEQLFDPELVDPQNRGAALLEVGRQLDAALQSVEDIGEAARIAVPDIQVLVREEDRVAAARLRTAEAISGSDFGIPRTLGFEPVGFVRRTQAQGLGAGPGGGDPLVDEVRNSFRTLTPTTAQYNQILRDTVAGIRAEQLARREEERALRVTAAANRSAADAVLEFQRTVAIAFEGIGEPVDLDRPLFSEIEEAARIRARAEREAAREARNLASAAAEAAREARNAADAFLTFQESQAFLRAGAAEPVDLDRPGLDLQRFLVRSGAIRNPLVAFQEDRLTKTFPGAGGPIGDIPSKALVGGLGLGDFFGEFEEKTRQAAQAQRDAAFEFANTITGAAFSFVDSLIRGIQEGDIGSVFASILEGAGGLAQSVSGLSGGALGILGIGSSLAGVLGPIGIGLGALGGIFGSLFGGRRRREEEAARAREATRTPPSLEFNFTNNQSVQVGSLVDPESRAVLSQMNDELVRFIEDRIIKRTLLPRIEALEDATGVPAPTPV